MKILFPFNDWAGGFQESMKTACEALGHEVYGCPRYKSSTPLRILNRIVSYFRIGLEKKIKESRIVSYNKFLIENVIRFKPDIFISIIGQGYLPQTIKYIQQELGIKTVSYVADNPCDPNRSKYFAMALRYFDVLLYPDDIWLKILDRLAPGSMKVKFLGGYDPKYFFPANVKSANEDHLQKLSHDIVFTGGSYDESAEGAYRAGILGQLAEDGYKIQIWGDSGWEFRKKFYPGLDGVINKHRLPYEDLRYLLQLSKIYLNMPSPQIFTAFQPRVFEIAAAKGFQIIDHSDDLYPIFGDDFVSFRSYADLKKKIDYYLVHPDERIRITEKMYEVVKENYTWKNQLSKVLDTF
jgi:glycosyltransferase involved in cell wall biosynthesis